LFLRISRGDTLKRGDITRYHDHTPLTMLLLPSHDPLNMQANQHKKAGQIVTGKSARIKWDPFSYICHIEITNEIEVIVWLFVQRKAMEVTDHTIV
jgi:hypothetical protein